jgi:tetratricopeptide (TPR) repeat protein
METSRPSVPVPDIERHPRWRSGSVLAFLTALVALAALAAFALLVPPRMVQGLPDDPRAREARQALTGTVELGFDGLRFRSALLGEAVSARPIPTVRETDARRAESLLVAVARRHPFDPRAHVALGSLALARRRWTEAESRYRRALDLRASCPEARLGLGVALAERALVETDPLRARGFDLMAIAQFAAVTRAAEVYPQALYDRALLLDRVGRNDEARRRAGAYLALDPTSPWAARLADALGARR